MQHPPDEIGRLGRSRFNFDPALEREPLGPRAASQPPRRIDSANTRIELAQRRFESSLSSAGSPSSTSDWPPPRHQASSPQDTSRSFPTRSVSFSSSELPSLLSSSTLAYIPDSRVFAATFEDDEESLDGFDTHTPRNMQRSPDDGVYGVSRSRSQSLATATRPAPVGSRLPIPGSYGIPQSWVDQGTTSFSPRYHDGIATGADGHSSFASPGTGYRRGTTDFSNMSPFVRDVGQILTDDGSAFRDLWGSTIAARDDGGGSGTTSRRHSVSVVQPRRGVSVGFSVPGEQGSPPTSYGELTNGSNSLRDRGGRGAMFSDDELAGGLNMLNLSFDNEPRRIPRVSGPSQPSSLPTYAPHRAVGSPIQRGDQDSIGLNLPVPQAVDFASSLSSSGRPSMGRTASFASSQYSDRDHSVSPGVGGRGDEHSGNGFASGNGLGLASTYQQSENNGFGSSAMQRGYSDGYRNPLPKTSQYQYQSNTQQPPPLSPTRFSNQPPPPQQQHSLPPPGTTNARNLPQLSFQGLRNAQYSVAAMSSPVSPTLPSYPRTMHQPLPPSPGNALGYYPQGVPPPQQLHQFQQPLGSQQQVHRGQGQHEPPAPPPSALNELGRGVPLHSVPTTAPLYIVEFKAGRTDIFYCSDPALEGQIRTGDLVIVEADRGKDLGRVANDSISPADVEAYQRQQAEHAQQQQAQMGGPGSSGDDGGGKSPRELMPKRIYGKAQPQDTQLLASKTSDEAKALQLCQTKVRQKKLPMEVVDAEYQWDRRKLTFYFVADRRIDFRELVRELFRLYKTRIWMACLQGPSAE